MTNLFKRTAVFSDLHLGKKNNDRQFNVDCENFVKWFIQQAEEFRADSVIFLGDFFDNRHSIHVSTLNYALSTLERLNNMGVPVYVITGNHDCYFKTKREITSVEIFRNFPNIHIVNDFLHQGGVTMCPWLVEDEWKRIPEFSARSSYVFGHFELPRFLMNALVEMPDHAGLNVDHFASVEHMTFTGHFHKRQVRNNVCYVGSPFPHDFADAWDDDRGCMLLEWGNKPEFRAWPLAPRYRTFKLSELLEDPDEHLDDRTYARIATDIDVSYEEAQFIKETFQSQYNPRKLDVSPGSRQQEQQEFTNGVAFQSVEQIVIDGINSIDSATMNKNLLIEIFRGLV